MKIKDFPIKSNNCLFIVEAKQMKVQYENLFLDLYLFFVENS